MLFEARTGYGVMMWNYDFIVVERGKIKTVELVVFQIQ
jgi:hypothetical protein